jgi:phosphonate transport system substrate-binding protein
MRQILNSFMCILLALAATVGCRREPENAGPRYGEVAISGNTAVYSFGVHPLHNPKKLFEAYQPLMEYLNAELPSVNFMLDASRDYNAYEAKFRNRKPDFLLPNPWQTLEAMKVGYHVIAMAGDREDFKGIFIVRKDSGINQPIDLKGRAVSYPSPTALAACIMPQYFLHQNGIDVNRDIENRYVGSQESSIMNAYLEKTAAGATWPQPWRAFQREHPEEAADLKVAWQTDPLINNSIMVRDDVPDTLQLQVRMLLTGLGATQETRNILAGMEIARFTAATDSDYAFVKEYISHFESEVRKVESK